MDRKWFDATESSLKPLFDQLPTLKNLSPDVAVGLHAYSELMDIVVKNSSGLSALEGLLSLREDHSDFVDGALQALSGVFAALVAAVLAQDHHHQLPVAEHHVEEHHYAHPKYEFKYGVKDPHTHDIKEQAEKRDGHKVESHYMLVEPDGTIRTVQYTADKHTGFHAHVQRSGHAVHPTH
ncbi:cuticle protein 8-like isoform X1 [Periplaneta americana]|uniref:cuticle protein 8-like isoform X1 n=1 Tax=Periplaneta americana TaxID=6978 RepID=UPI0037E7A36B